MNMYQVVRLAAITIIRGHKSSMAWRWLVSSKDEPLHFISPTQETLGRRICNLGLVWWISSTMGFLPLALPSMKGRWPINSLETLSKYVTLRTNYTSRLMRMSEGRFREAKMYWKAEIDWCLIKRLCQSHGIARLRLAKKPSYQNKDSALFN